MPSYQDSPATAFQDDRIIAAGPLRAVAPAVKAALDRSPDAAVLVFDDATGTVIDLDLRGSDAEIVRRLEDETGDGGRTPSNGDPGVGVRGPGTAEGTVLQKRGRPKLGVVAREVTLLPRHWQWLAAQPGGASNALRRLTETAMRADQGRSDARARKEAAYRFMSAMAGDLPGFEEATRALFADDRPRFAEQSKAWPEHVRAYVAKLAWEPGEGGR
jgi:hypothetical protein